MKKIATFNFRKIILISFIILMIFSPLWMILYWRFQKSKIFKIIIIDKTVSDLPRQEHRGFNWILTYERFTKTDKNLYVINEDYFGFFPLEPIEEDKFEIHDLENYSFDELDLMSQKTDMLYFTDTYGVFANEWYHDTLQTEHSNLVYGGLTSKEVFLAQKLKEQNKLILSEFNTIGSPTNIFQRTEFENTFDIKWSGWTVRYFDMLDTLINPELPKWVIRLYKQQHNNEWNFHKSGLVFVHEDSRLFILENETNLVIETPFIHTSEKYQKIFGLPDSIHYPFWIDITFSGDSNQIVSDYKIYPNSIGDSILNVYKVPKTFPAVIAHFEPYIFYYFAGDYVDNPIVYNTCYFKGIKTFDYFLYNNEPNNRTKFFWKFYCPLVTKILKDYYKKI